MEKYKRFKEQLPDDDAIQGFLNKVTAEGWEILYYDEKAWGGMGIMEVVIVGKKKHDEEPIIEMDWSIKR